MSAMSLASLAPGPAAAPVLVQAMPAPALATVGSISLAAEPGTRMEMLTGTPPRCRLNVTVCDCGTAPALPTTWAAVKIMVWSDSSSPVPLERLATDWSSCTTPSRFVPGTARTVATALVPMTGITRISRSITRGRKVSGLRDFLAALRRETVFDE